jgi:hypothetical protein
VVPLHQRRPGGLLIATNSLAEDSAKQRDNAATEYDGEVEQAVETTADEGWCPGCGVRARLHDRRPSWVRDLPAVGRPVTLVCAGTPPAHAVSHDALRNPDALEPFIESGASPQNQPL